ncbi:interferon phi 1 [Paralichthys olivaceus]|uniref:TypeI interferon 4 n=1 Tax=Paralichthys olivaceus TaxID=8255 RepID=A0A286T8C2_PAROL|nr:typeI interferon 4 [Paralichthys olivaceus]
MIRCTIILCALTSALCCDWLRHYNHYSNVTLTLLRQMGGQLTEDESPVSFPFKLYTQVRHRKVESQLIFIKNSLLGISDLYRHDNLSSPTWDTKVTHHFQVNLHRLKEELNTCVPTSKQLNRRLTRYYTRLRRTLDRTGGSIASWELIRKETELHLHQLQLLVTSILNSAASRRR